MNSAQERRLHRMRKYVTGVTVRHFTDERGQRHTITIDELARWLEAHAG